MERRLRPRPRRAETEEAPPSPSPNPKRRRRAAAATARRRRRGPSSHSYSPPSSPAEIDAPAPSVVSPAASEASHDASRESPAAAEQARAVRVRLPPRKKGAAPASKCPSFLTSPSSIWAAASKFESLLDALHGGDANIEVEDARTLVHIHFGGCPTFAEEFDACCRREGEEGENDARELDRAALEEALHRSVRHLCPRKCFLRAYHPIREFAFLWRDVAIFGRATRGEVFDGWGCRVFPPPPEPEPEGGEGGDTVPASHAPSIAFISPDDEELGTRAKAVGRLDELCRERSPSRLQRTTTTTTTTKPTALASTASQIHPLCSPFGLLEELFLHDPWKLLVSTICLNVTTRQAVDGVLHEFLERWPDAESTAAANWEDVSEVVAILGLGTKRAKGLVRFSNEWLDLLGRDPRGGDGRDDDETEGGGGGATADRASALSEKEVRSLHMVGGYGWAAYEAFILGRLPERGERVQVCDHALQLYVEYRLGKRGAEDEDEEKGGMGIEMGGEDGLGNGRRR